MALAQLDSLDLSVDAPTRLSQAIVGAFQSARLAGRALSEYPGNMPNNLVQAYAIQDAAIDAWPDTIAGWKVGRILGDLAVEYGADRLIGPIFDQSVQTVSEAKATQFGAITGGFCAVEAEYVFKIGVDTKMDGRWLSDSDALDLVASLHIGVEIAGSPLASINDLGPCVVISDFGNNAGLIVGPAIQDWRSRVNDLSASMSIEGVEIGRGHVSAFPDGIIGSLKFALTKAAQRCRPLKKGMYVSTGAVTGVHSIIAGQSAVADFGNNGRIACVCEARG
jgi:2-keto-4-pentenoate hydratase